MVFFQMLQHNSWYTRSLSFQYEPNIRLPGQSKQLEQSLKYVLVNNKDTCMTPLKSF